MWVFDGSMKRERERERVMGTWGAAPECGWIGK